MKTPRTDRNERIVLGGVGGDWKVVTSDFARQLERELQSMTAMADRLAEAIAHSPYDESLAEALAAYESHKKPDQPAKKPCDCIEKCGKYWIQRCDCQNGTSLAEVQSWCDYENKKGNTQ